jgi:ABC-type cobalt transport system substrate-binding protein
MNRIKLITIFSLLTLVIIIANNSRQFSSSAKDDEVLSEITKYKSWTKVSKEPIKVESDALTIGGLSGG